MGIAPDATVVCVKVLSDQGAGPFSDIISGLDYVASIKAANPNRRVVVSMSVGGAKDTVSAWVSMEVVVSCHLRSRIFIHTNIITMYHRR